MSFCFINGIKIPFLSRFFWNSEKSFIHVAQIHFWNFGNLNKHKERKEKPSR